MEITRILSAIDQGNAVVNGLNIDPCMAAVVGSLQQTKESGDKSPHSKTESGDKSPRSK